MAISTLMTEMTDLPKQIQWNLEHAAPHGARVRVDYDEIAPALSMTITVPLKNLYSSGESMVSIICDAFQAVIDAEQGRMPIRDCLWAQ